MDHSISNRFFYAAVVFALIGMAGGIFMSAAHDYTAAPAHAHTLLLGWVSMAIFGFFYRLVPQVAGRLASIHWWLMVLAVPVMGVGVALIRYGNAATGEPLAAASSFAVIGAMVLFGINVVRGLGGTARAPHLQPAE